MWGFSSIRRRCGEGRAGLDLGYSYPEGRGVTAYREHKFSCNHNSYGIYFIEIRERVCARSRFPLFST